jgi:hypothetical protein
VCVFWLIWLIFDSEKLIRISSAFLTPLIAVIAVWIAFRQWRTQHLQYRLALFDQRLEVFNRTMTFIALVMQQGTVTPNDCTQLLVDTREHQFLFGPEIGEFIDQVYGNGVDLHTHLAINPPQAAQAAAILNWFATQMREGRNRFKVYMDFTNP